MWAKWLTWFGVEPRGFAALVQVFLLNDLREQYYARATASKPYFAISPLFLVVGQCLTASVVACAFLFARVDVFFFVFVNLSLSLLVMASAIVVEFQEVVLNPTDLGIIGPRPVSPRTYAAARLANLLFYFVLIFVGLNLFPAMVGAGLRDAGWLYAPAYLTCSLSAHLVLMAVMVVSLSLVDEASLTGFKAILSWVQIVAILVVVYGGQMMVRDSSAALQVWGAFPPAWVDWVPVTWLARFVERAAEPHPTPELGLYFASFVLLGLLSCVVTIGWLARLCSRMQPVEMTGVVSGAMPPHQVGSLQAFGSWLASTPEQRVGYWLALTFFRRDPALAMRCLFAFQVAVASAVVGIVMGQFDNPIAGTLTPATMALPLVAVFAIPLAAPALVFNLTYCRDSAGGWLLHAAPGSNPFDLAWGACKAALLWVVTPLCVALGIVCGLVWGDAVSAVLHAALAWGLTWVLLLASLWLITPALPFSLPAPRGVGLTIPPLPALAMGLSLASLGAVHALAARYPAYWVVVFALLPAGWLFAPLARQRLHRLGGPS